MDNLDSIGNKKFVHNWHEIFGEAVINRPNTIKITPEIEKPKNKQLELAEAIVSFLPDCAMEYFGFVYKDKIYNVNEIRVVYGVELVVKNEVSIMPSCGMIGFIFTYKDKMYDVQEIIR